jgi:hypothetical protein
MPGPPVARIRLMSGWCISSLETSIEGSSTQAMMPAGAPAATAASYTMRAASQVALAARGCGQKMMPLRVLRLINALKIAVEVGLVVGTIAQINPIGSAMVRAPYSLSSSRMPQVFSSLYLL